VSPAARLRAEAHRLIAAGHAKLAEAEAIDANRDPTAPDALVPIAACGIDARAARRHVIEGTLPATRQGRRIMVRRSDVLRLVERFPVAPRAAPAAANDADASGYAAIVATVGGRRP
jgi:hypothetical protein